MGRFLAREEILTIQLATRLDKYSLLEPTPPYSAAFTRQRSLVPCLVLSGQLILLVVGLRSPLESDSRPPSLSWLGPMLPGSEGVGHCHNEQAVDWVQRD